jgi:hypothetical protein
MALSGAERARLFRERRAAGVKTVAYRRPKDRRSRLQQWQDAVQTLIEVMDAYQEWRDSLPPGMEESLTAERLDAALELRELIEQLEAAELPRGFGRD